jgi:hypothetical protein
MQDVRFDSQFADPDQMTFELLLLAKIQHEAYEAGRAKAARARDLASIFDEDEVDTKVDRTLPSRREAAA